MTVVIAVVFPPFMLSPRTLSPLAALIALQLFIRFVAFMPPVTCLRAVVPKVFDRLMQPPFGISHAPVAIIPVVGLRADWCGRAVQLLLVTNTAVRKLL